MYLKVSGELPTKNYPSDAGWDLRSQQVRTIQPGDRTLIRTGTKVAIPYGSAGFICPRSGLALKHGITVLNAPGVIDTGYTDEIGVILYNAGDEPFTVQKGDRIAQLVVVELLQHSLLSVEDDEISGERGDNGFGSSGVAA